MNYWLVQFIAGGVIDWHQRWMGASLEEANRMTLLHGGDIQDFDSFYRHGGWVFP